MIYKVPCVSQDSAFKTWRLLNCDRIAYIEFKTEAIAEKVLEEKQGIEVQGRVIVIDFLGEKSQQQKMINPPGKDGLK